MRGCYVQMPKRLGMLNYSSLMQKGKRGDYRRAVDVAVVPLVFCALRFSSYFFALIRCFRHATLFVLFIPVIPFRHNSCEFYSSDSTPPSNSISDISSGSSPPS